MDEAGRGLKKAGLGEPSHPHAEAFLLPLPYSYFILFFKTEFSV